MQSDQVRRLVVDAFEDVDEALCDGKKKGDASVFGIGRTGERERQGRRKEGRKRGREEEDAPLWACRTLWSLGCLARC